MVDGHGRGADLGGEPRQPSGEEVAERAGGEPAGGGVPGRRVDGQGAPSRQPGRELAEPPELGGTVGAHRVEPDVAALRRPAAEGVDDGVVLDVEEQRQPPGEVLDRLVEGEQSRRLAPPLDEADRGEGTSRGEEEVVPEDDHPVGAADDVDLEPGEVEGQGRVEALAVVGPPGARGREPGVADQLHPPIVAATNIDAPFFPERPYHDLEMARLRAATVVLGLCLAAASTAGAGGRGAPAAPVVAGAPSPGAAAPVTPVPRGAFRFGGNSSAVPVPVAGSPPRPGVPWFLTIGDSITFGYTLDQDLAGTNISWALDLQRMLAAEGHHWTLYDVACPGESTVSYPGRCSGRRQVPFLARESQRQAALGAIAANGSTLRLIVVALGSNDLLGALLRPVGPTTATLVANLGAILSELRAAASGVPIVVADAYDPFAVGAPQTDAVLTPIDDALRALAASLGDGFADWHAAINHPADGAPLCALIDCADLDIHPTVAGQQRLAEAAMLALPRTLR